MSFQSKKLFPYLLRIIIFLSSFIINFRIFRFENPGTLVPFSLFLLGVLIFHSINYIGLKKEYKKIKFVKPIPDIIITVFFLTPFMLLIDQQMKGDFDIVPQLIAIFLSYTLIFKLHFKAFLSFFQSIIIGINIGLNISIIWTISLFLVFDVKAPGHKNPLVIISIFILTYIISFLTSSKLFIIILNKRRLMYLISVLQISILMIVILVSN